ncbi:MAG: RDD family protein [Planctomycetota bacterium]|jgi:uncharacterized RDD family membrane protein YckC
MDDSLISSDANLPTTEEHYEAIISGFWRRLLAFIIDGIIIGIVGLVLGIYFFDFFAQLGGWGRLLGFGIAILYFGTLNSSFSKGQTLGKRLLRIRVVDESGETINLAKSFLRFTIFSTPFFMNGIMLPFSIVNSIVGQFIGVTIFGVGGAIIYLYIFNRKTRQSLHDLLVRTYIIRTSKSGPVKRAKISKTHVIVVGIWISLVFIFMVIISPIISRSWKFPEIFALLNSIHNLEKVHGESMFDGKHWGAHGETTYVRVSVVWKGKPNDFENAINEIAAIVLKEYPYINEKDTLSVSVSYGYDIGIARAWISRYANYPPGEWKQKLVQFHGSE